MPVRRDRCQATTRRALDQEIIGYAGVDRIEAERQGAPLMGCSVPATRARISPRR
jgi:hypothetical protein